MQTNDTHLSFWNEATDSLRRSVSEVIESLHESKIFGIEMEKDKKKDE